jgi:hypothetical protein
MNTGKKDDKDKLDWSLIPLWIFESGILEQWYQELSISLQHTTPPEVSTQVKKYFCQSERYRVTGRCLQEEDRLCAAIAACLVQSYREWAPNPSRTVYDAMESVIPVLAFGAEKYGRFNWINVAPERYASAAFRHILAFQSGQEIDTESGLLTIRHVAANLILLLALSKL